MKILQMTFLGLVTLSSCSLSETKGLAIGKEVFIANCVSCHQSDGNGITGLYPSLLKPNGIEETQTDRAIFLIKYGSGEIGMRPVSLDNEEISQVVNYIQNSWGNEASIISKTKVDELLN